MKCYVLLKVVQEQNIYQDGMLKKKQRNFIFIEEIN